MTAKGYYKGTRSGNTGHFSYKPNRYYIYEIDRSKVQTFVVPSIFGESQLTPFVADRVKAPKYSSMKVSAKALLDYVKDNGAELS